MGWVAAAFAAISVVDSIVKWVHNSKQEADAIAEKERQRDANLAMLDMTFEQEKNKANKTAENINKETTFGEVVLGKEINGALEQLGIGQEERTLDYNMASMNSTGQAGAGYQQLATSGTKNSSSKAAVDMQQNLNEQMLQNQENADRAKENLTLESAINAMQTGDFNLQKNRTGAKDLVDAYKEGGDAYKIYQANRKNIEEGANYQIAAMQSELDFSNNYTNTIDLLSNATKAFGAGAEFYSDIKDAKFNWS